MSVLRPHKTLQDYIDNRTDIPYQFVQKLIKRYPLHTNLLTLDPQERKNNYYY